MGISLTFIGVAFNWVDLKHKTKIDFQIVIVRIVRCSIKSKYPKSSKVVHNKIVMILQSNVSKICIGYLKVKVYIIF